MNVLVLGCNTMLGRTIMQQFIDRDHFVHGTMHEDISDFKYISKDVNAHYYGFIDAANQPEVFDDIAKLFEFADPDVVINCIDTSNRAYADKRDDKYTHLTVNAVFPNTISQMCKISGARFIQVSDASVFAGKRARYTEFDTPDASSLYGKSKHLGEIEDQPHALTLRCSTFGREILSHQGLFEHLATNPNKTICGRANVVYNPLTALGFAKIVVEIVEQHPQLAGVYNISTKTAVSEYQLAQQINEVFKFDVTVTPLYSEPCTFVLDADLFDYDTHITIPSLDTMIREFCREYSDNR